jgi:RES domain-containing protein
VVYTSATTSLGLLEKMVHTEEGLPSIFVTIPVTFDAHQVETIELERLPDNWRALPAPFPLKRFGDGWVDSMRSCVLEIPSVIVPHESNFILNPEHPDFPSLEIGDPIDLDIDQRLA